MSFFLFYDGKKMHLFLLLPPCFYFFSFLFVFNGSRKLGIRSAEGCRDWGAYHGKEVLEAQLPKGLKLAWGPLKVGFSAHFQEPRFGGPPPLLP